MIEKLSQGKIIAYTVRDILRIGRICGISSITFAETPNGDGTFSVGDVTGYRYIVEKLTWSELEYTHETVGSEEIRNHWEPNDNGKL